MKSDLNNLCATCGKPCAWDFVLRHPVTDELCAHCETCYGAVMGKCANCQHDRYLADLEAPYNPYHLCEGCLDDMEYEASLYGDDDDDAEVVEE